MNKKTTKQGFDYIEFEDRYEQKCSLQESSLADERAIWLGIDDPNPLILASKIMEGGTGWVKYIIPEDVLIHTRMHLTQEMVKNLLPHLQKFVETGEL